MAEFKLPTETVELPSKGLLYPEGSPLASGTIEMKYMTAKEEDILTNSNFLANGTAIDKLLQSLIVTEGVDFNEILIGDKNAIMIAARILAYGKDFEFQYKGGTATADLSTLKHKFLPDGLFENRTNEFEFNLPHSGNVITFKLLTHGDERKIERELKGLQKINKDANPEGSTRLKYMITSVNGTRETAEIRKFVDGFLLAKDAREFRKFYATISPDVEMTTSIQTQDGVEEGVEVPVTLNFFWPDFDL